MYELRRRARFQFAIFTRKLFATFNSLLQTYTTYNTNCTERSYFHEPTKAITGQSLLTRQTLRRL